MSATPSPQAGNVVVALGPYHDRVTADRNGKAELLSTGSIESCQPGDLLPNIGATHVAFEHVGRVVGRSPLAAGPVYPPGRA